MPFDTSVPATEQILEVLRRVDEGNGVFRSPFMQSVAWHCAECGFFKARVAEFPPEDEVTQSDWAPVRGRWRWVGLSDRGRAYLERGGPLKPSVLARDEDTPARREARERAVERAKESASNASD